MKKVAISYFAASLLLVFAAMFLPEDFNNRFSGYSLSEIFSQVLIQLFVFLQPQFFLLKILETNPAGGLIDAIEFWGCVISMPLWSICFSWAFVKFDNWLNHFSVLGRKVF